MECNKLNAEAEKYRRFVEYNEIMKDGGYKGDLKNGGRNKLRFNERAT